MNRRRFLGTLAGTLAAPLALEGCSRHPALVEEGFMVFNMPMTLRFANEPADKITAAVNAAAGIVEPLYRRIHPWKPSDLTHFNAELAAHGAATATPEILDLIEISRTLFDATDGAFDPTIGALIAAWGFHDSHVTTPHPLPSEAFLDAWLANRPTMRDVTVTGQEVHTTNRRVQFDFNGCAEGYAAHLVMRRIEQLGIKNCLFDTGGDLFMIGQAGDKPWHLAIENPIGRGVLCSIDLSGHTQPNGHQSLNSSGNYEHRFIYQGEAYSHIINPHTARPVRRVAGSTIWGHHYPICDGATKGAMLLEPEQVARMAQRLNLSGVLYMQDNGALWLDEGMRAQIQPLSQTVDWNATHLIPRDAS
ncbi:FAD:protein FMN transferase [Halothiobacillus sp. DCM-1]|uniref:FAD:protein FMN transferase n=1 Tax=Halothiobacillus sp. DCM-1 TaxID=3112558 RepID=UPI0032542D37